MEIVNTLVNVYIDLSKAFDTLNFDVLLFKLKYYGVTDTALDLMRIYLANRKQYVVFNSCQSDYILKCHGDLYWVPYSSVFTLMIIL